MQGGRKWREKSGIKGRGLAVQRRGRDVCVSVRIAHTCTYREIRAIGEVANVDTDAIHVAVDESEGLDVVTTAVGPGASVIWISGVLVRCNACKADQLDVLVAEGTCIV